MSKFDYKPDGEVLRQYMKSDDFWRGIRGPVGSGKSVGSAVELFRRACEQAPNPKGIRKTRWGIIRNTGPQLKTTTIKTWLEWFPEEIFGPFRWGIPYTHHIKVGDLDMENIFLALDSEEDIRKLLSLELTGIWANEAREMPKSIIDACTMRCGRYPSMRDGGPTWYGMICDTNAPEDDHWWPIMSGEAPIPEFMSDEDALMLRRPKGWSFFTQPPAMLEIKNEESEVTGYKMNPERENGKHLTPEYYNKIIAGKRRDWIKVYILNLLGTVSEGKSVYNNYNDETHKAKDFLDVMPGRTIWVGLDFGLSPAAIFAQRSGRGQWHIIDEIVADNMSTPEFTRVVKAKLGELLVSPEQQFKVYGDPSGDDRDPNTEGSQTTIQIMRANGLQVFAAPLPSNLPSIRIETVKHVLDRSIDGHPGMLVSPRCSSLIKGFRGGYCYRRIGGSGSPRYDPTPMKNPSSHPHDGLQYLLLGAGEGRSLTNSRSTGDNKAIAKTKWSVFGSKKKSRRSRRMNI